MNRVYQEITYVFSELLLNKLNKPARCIGFRVVYIGTVLADISGTLTTIFFKVKGTHAD